MPKSSAEDRVDGRDVELVGTQIEGTVEVRPEPPPGGG